MKVINKLVEDFQKEQVKNKGINVLLATRQLESFAIKYAKIHYKTDESRIIPTEHYGKWRRE